MAWVLKKKEQLQNWVTPELLREKASKQTFFCCAPLLTAFHLLGIQSILVLPICLVLITNYLLTNNDKWTRYLAPIIFGTFLAIAYLRAL